MINVSTLNKFMKTYEKYRKFGLNHAHARLNTLDDANIHGLNASDRIQLSYHINKAGKGV